jgi:hypothetical protein
MLAEATVGLHEGGRPKKKAGSPKEPGSKPTLAATPGLVANTGPSF